ncbi:MAG: alpha/beta hydrolase [Actinomycetota bacterium]|nr:alpha/beta hydrolase [Actinomycetota bacterium]
MSKYTSQIILLPGGVLPAGLAYGSLLEALGDDVEAVAKDLEMYAGERPPDGFTLDVEIAGVLRTAEQAGFERFHLVGYSAGGASSLAFAARHPERLLSLSLMEPAWAGNAVRSPQEQRVWGHFDRVCALPDDELMGDFVRVQLRPGVQPPTPTPGPPPPWMAKRPPGIRAFMHAFRTGELDFDVLRTFGRPVYFALGGLSNPDYYERMAERLATIFPDFTVEVYDDRHHFDPPHRAEPERVATALKGLWARAEALVAPVAR